MKSAITSSAGGRVSAADTADADKDESTWVGVGEVKDEWLTSDAAVPLRSTSLKGVDV